MRCAETGGANQLFGCLLSALDGQITPGKSRLQPTRTICCAVPAAWCGVNFHRASATTLSASGVGSDNSPARAMSSIECSVMYLE